MFPNTKYIFAITISIVSDIFVSTFSNIIINIGTNIDNVYIINLVNVPIPFFEK